MRTTHPPGHIGSNLMMGTNGHISLGAASAIDAGLHSNAIIVAGTARRHC